jgi:hypothetical protein
MTTTILCHEGTKAPRKAMVFRSPFADCTRSARAPISVFLSALVPSWLTSLVLALALTLVLPACAPMGWQRYEQATAVEHASKNFKVTMPANWVRFNQAQRDMIVVTRDGLRVQQIMAAYAPHDKAFDQIKKKSAESMLPAELAELQIAEMKALGNLSNLEVLENAPAKLGGLPAFRALTQFKNGDGLPIKIEIIGAVNAKGYYLLQYQAPDIHYFERDRAEFVRVAQSFQAM